MSCKKLRYITRFMCYLNSLDYFKECIKEFVTEFSKNFTNLEVHIEWENETLCVIDYSSDADLWEISFVVTCKNFQKESDVGNFATSFTGQWCKEANSNVHIQWLMTHVNNFTLPSYKIIGSAKVSEFAFGTIPKMKTFVPRYVFQQKQNLSSISCAFSNLTRTFTVYVSNSHKLDCNDLEMGHKVVISYNSIVRIICDLNPNKQAAEIFFHLDTPPLIYIHYDTLETTTKCDESIFSPQAMKVTRAKRLEYGLGKFERSFYLGCICNSTLCASRKIAKSQVLKIKIFDKFQTRWILDQILLSCLKKTELFFSSLHTVKIKSLLPKFKHFPWPDNLKSTLISEVEKFNCDYAWHAVHHRSEVLQHEFVLNSWNDSTYNQCLTKKLQECAIKNSSATADALFYIADMIDKCIIFSFLDCFEKKFEYFCNFKQVAILPKGICYARRVLITPSRLMFLKPYEHFENRIIRKFSPEYMLRISIQDDNYNKLTYAVRYNSKKDELMKLIVGDTLKKGLQIGSRHYKLLAASNSQFREHGIWMYANDVNGNTAESIRYWMGDFNFIKNVAKYMARMGQCLSSTEEGVQLSLSRKNEFKLKEITSQNGRYIFSDGIGTISSDLANEVRCVLMENRGSALENTVYQPSAFQIRYKGCKGMVVEDPTLRGRTIGIRPSMNKFECINSDQLEIVKTSAPRKLFLNKHLITILEQMGITKEIFLDLQSDMIITLLNSLIDEKAAVKFLANNLTITFPFDEISASGFCVTNEPFFRLLILAFFKSAMARIGSKMRIAIPEEYGRNLMGVLDETKTLKYGEVFIQYSESTSIPNSALKILQGPVIVTKNPCLHPGDVRKLTAVDVSNLHHIKDCIVFPARGARPHPNEMAGSDLDGDEYVALWDEKLTFKRCNATPMDYPSYVENEVPNIIGVEEMVDFICYFIQNDCIGSFANAHLVWADKLKSGIFSKQCLNIAKNYPYVLDFAKHGTTKYLKKSERPEEYPDFMQKGLSGNSYHSKNALGSLYRSFRVLDACASKINLAYQSSSRDSDLCYLGWQKYEASAKFHRDEYNAMVTEVLKKYGMKNETEAFSGFVPCETFAKFRKEQSNAAKLVKCYLKNIMYTFKNIFVNEINAESEKYCLNSEDLLVRKYQRASAWYMVSYGQESEEFLSFPWIVNDILMEIKKASTQRVKRDFFIDLDNDIKQYCGTDIQFIEQVNNKKCHCTILSHFILSKWIIEFELNVQYKNKKIICTACSDRIIDYFYQFSGISCCSSLNTELCSCLRHCSPSRLILEFLKYFIKNTDDTLGKCRNTCKGFVARNLQEISLQTLAYLSITRDIQYLGLQFDTKNFTKCSVVLDLVHDIFEEKGEPIKIPVKTDILQKLIENYRDEVIVYLKEFSGVKHILLQPELERGAMCIVINSIGKSWQRWNLQELLLDNKFTEILQENILNKA